MSLYDRIRIRREALGMSQEELAFKLGYKSRSSINKIELGKADISQSKIKAFADALDTTVAYLMGWDVSEQPIPPGFEPLPEGAEFYKPKRVMPVLGCVRAGMPRYADENIEEYIACDYTDEYEYFALKVKGDSMNAVGINEGDYVVVRSQDIVENGEIAIVLVNGDEATVKKFDRNGDTIVLTPQSYNPKHQVQIYNIKDVPIRVIGKVMETRHKF